MVIMMVGVIIIQLDFSQGFQKCMILGVLSELESTIGHESEGGKILQNGTENGTERKVGLY